MYEVREDLINLLINKEGWLMDRVSEYAQNQKNLGYLLINQQEFRESVNRISNSIGNSFKLFDISPVELLDDHKNQKELNSIGAIEARKQHYAGIDAQTYFKLIKHYRQSYIDLVSEMESNSSYKSSCNIFINKCFNIIEFGFIAELNKISEDKINNIFPNAIFNNGNRDEHYAMFFESFFAPVILLDNQEKIVNFNQAAVDFFPKLCFSGCFSDSNFISRQTLHEIQERINELLHSQFKESSFELFVDTTRGKKYLQLHLKKIVNSNGKYAGTLISFNDLSKYKESEENLKKAILKAEESSQLKSAFLANMSHEIRTPMNAILGFTDLLLSSRPSKKENKEFLQLIRTSGKDLLTIIEDLIDFAKIESKQLKIKLKPCRLYDIIIDLQALFHEVFKRFGISSSVELIIKVSDADKNLIINTDKERLKQVLTNLLNNAAKFTDKGFIEFGYRLSNSSELLFFVRDSGIGIPTQMKDKIFDRFTQVESKNLKEYTGAGLGLAISKNIVKLLGGDIWVESIPYEGSEFFFSLPLLKVANQTENKSSVGAASNFKPKYYWPKKVILIAEDDESNFLYLHEILKDTHVRILWARNGMDAINIVKSGEHIDCILMDIKMPEISGIEASKYITSIKSDIPIIAQTAFALEGDKEKCLNSGCNAYITKPVRKDKLFALLEDFLHVNNSVEMKLSSF